MVLPGVAIVVSPLVALMVLLTCLCTCLLQQDQVAALKAKGINACTYNSSLSAAVRQELETDLLSSNPRVKLLYVTPEMIATSVLSFFPCYFHP